MTFALVWCIFCLIISIYCAARARGLSQRSVEAKARTQAYLEATEAIQRRSQ